jgi:DNA-binding CsgD family transcriptional regulator
MEKVEFFVIGRQTCIQRNGVSKPLTPSDRDAVEFMLERMQECFPAAMARLQEWAEESKPNRRFFEFRIVDRFIRCNFGEADFLYSDIEDGMFHFEEVKCPLRGICKDENVVCKPKFSMPVPKEESRAALLYSRGLTANEIAKVLGKGVKTVKNQLGNAARRLGLSRTRDLIKIFSVYNITMFE